MMDPRKEREAFEEMSDARRKVETASIRNNNSDKKRKRHVTV